MHCSHRQVRAGLHADRSRLQCIALLPLLTVCCLSCHRNQAGPWVDPSMPSKDASNVPASFTRIGAGVDLSRQTNSRYHVTYADNLVRIPAGTVRNSIIGANRDHDIYIFQNDPELRAKLLPGKVVLFEGLSSKKIQAIAEDGSHLIVGMENASLTEVFKDADIRWNTPINFLEIHNRQAQSWRSLAT